MVYIENSTQAKGSIVRSYPKAHNLISHLYPVEEFENSQIIPTHPKVGEQLFERVRCPETWSITHTLWEQLSERIRCPETWSISMHWEANKSYSTRGSHGVQSLQLT